MSFPIRRCTGGGTSLLSGRTYAPASSIASWALSPQTRRRPVTMLLKKKKNEESWCPIQHYNRRYYSVLRETTATPMRHGTGGPHFCIARSFATSVLDEYVQDVGKKTYTITPEVMKALIVYRTREGHVRVPYKFNFSVESNSGDVNGSGSTSSSWPNELVGYKLGSSVAGTRKAYKASRLTATDVAYLEGIGFVWDTEKGNWQRILLALDMYIQLKGNANVSRKWKVPSEAPWPKEAWGDKLGVAVNQIRSKECYIKENPERRDELNKRGFRFKGTSTV